MRLTRWIITHLIKWLIKEKPDIGIPLCNFRRIRGIIKPCDVVLVEGRSRSSSIIKLATRSPWSHAALSIGPLNKIKDPETRQLIRQHYDGPEHRLLIIEALMDRGVVVSDLQEEYGRHHLRICRPSGLSSPDSLSVLRFASRRLGHQYDFHHLLDLARYLLPYHILPRRWGSRLYHHHEYDVDKTVCSSLLARAFMSVSFPIIPLLKLNKEGELIMYRRNFRIMTPRDFDVSPYFDVVKYPLLSANDLTDYRNLPWDTLGRVCNTNEDCFIPETKKQSSHTNIGWNLDQDNIGLITSKLSDYIPSRLLAWNRSQENRLDSESKPHNKHLNNGEA